MPASPEPFTVCVYCGSRPGTQVLYADLARRLGTAIGRRGWQLMYGCGRAGLMGTLADAALDAGARVAGVIPASLMRREAGHPGLHELQVVETMHERKHAMAIRSHAFIAMPGGLGTFEELFEVWTWRHLEYHRCPIGLLDAGGYYEPLMRFMRHAVTEGFVSPAQMDMLTCGDDPEALLDALHTASRHPGPDRPQNLERI